MKNKKSIVDKIKSHIDVICRIAKVKYLIQHSNYEGKNKQKHIAIESIRDDPFYNIATYILAYFLAQRAEQVYLLKDSSDDGVLLHYDSATSINQSNLKQRGVLGKILKIIGNKILYFRQPKNIKILTYKGLIDKKELDKAIRQKELFSEENYSKHIDASHQRYFGGRPFDIKNIAHLEYAKKSYFNEIINLLLAKKLVCDYGIEHYITMDGIYVTYGVLVEELRRLGCKVLIYQMDGFQNRTIFIGEQPAAVNIADSAWHIFLEKSQIHSNLEEGNLFLEERVKSRDEKFTKDEESLAKEIEQKRKKYKKTIVLFPNKTWDGAIKERDIIFSSMVDWLIETVDYCTKKDYLVILREHPEHRETFSEFESSISLFKEVAPTLLESDNLILVDGLKQINSYKIIERWADLSIVYNGTLGIEIAYLGKALIFAGASPYGHKNIAFEPQNQKEYFNLIDTVSTDSDPFQQEKSIFSHNVSFAAYYQFIENTYYFPIFPKVSDMSKGYKKYWQTWEIRELDPRKNKRWKKTLDKFLMQKI